MITHRGKFSFRIRSVCSTHLRWCSSTVMSAAFPSLTRFLRPTSLFLIPLILEQCVYFTNYQSDFLIHNKLCLFKLCASSWYSGLVSIPFARFFLSLWTFIVLEIVLCIVLVILIRKSYFLLQVAGLHCKAFRLIFRANQLTSIWCTNYELTRFTSWMVYGLW